MNNLSELIKKFKKNEWKFMIVISILLIFFISAPFVYGIFQSGENLIFNGKHSLSPGDLPVYYSYINQIKNGGYFLINQFTAEPDQLKILNVFWLGAGLFAKSLGLAGPAAVHILRLIFIPIFVFSLYLFLSLFFQKTFFKKTLTVLLCFSSGLGFYFTKMRVYENSYLKSPIDLWVSESNIFTSLYHSPHFAFSWILIIFTFIFFFLAAQNRKFKYSIFAGLSGLILFQFHPYHFPTVYAVAFVYCLALWLKNKKYKHFLHFFLLFIFSAPAVFYHFYTLSDPLISARSLQNITLTPPLIFIILGYGIFFPLAFFGLYEIFKKNKEDKYLFLIIWLFISLFLIYLPNYQFQRRLLQGLQIPLIAFALCGVWPFFEKKIITLSKKYYFPLIMFLLVFLIAPTTLYNLSRDIIFAEKRINIFYLTKQQNQVIEFLHQKNAGQKTILSQDTHLSNVLPANTNHKMFAAHQHETLDFENKLKIKNQFFINGLNNRTAFDLIKNYRISCIIAQSPLNYDFLPIPNKIGSYYIYQITNP